jgi:hypothetical protein
MRVRIADLLHVASLESHWYAISLLALTLRFTPIIVAMAFQETSGRVLASLKAE